MNEGWLEETEGWGWSPRLRYGLGWLVPGNFVKFWMQDVDSWYLPASSVRYCESGYYYIGRVLLVTPAPFQDDAGRKYISYIVEIDAFTVPLATIPGSRVNLGVELRDINLFGLSIEFNQLELVAPDGIFVDMPGLTLSIRELYEAVINR